MAERHQSQKGSSGHQQIFARLGRNVGWLASATGVQAVTSLAFTAIAARTLGPRGFGGYALILTYAQLIGNLVHFDSWAAVIRYGAARLDDRPALTRLFGLTALMDWLSAAAGILIAVAFIPLASAYLGWSPQEGAIAGWFAAILLITTGSTPTGVLRLFDRFDLLAYTEIVAPLIRLAGAIACMMLGGGLIAFLAVWLVSTSVQVLVQWVAALAVGGRFAIGPGAIRSALAENPRILPFMVKTNLASSIGHFWLQFGTLAAGWVAGPVEAGGFRIAYRFSQALTKPINMVTRALFPEFARLAASNHVRAGASVLARISLVAAGFATLVLIAVGLGGPAILRLIAGPGFEFAQPFFFLLTIAAAIDLAGFALNPFLNAHGKAGQVLRAGIVAVVVYGALILVLTPLAGARGVALASIGASLVIAVQLLASSLRTVRSADTGAAPAGPAAGIGRSDHPDENLR